MKYYIISGDTSGDQHGSAVIQELAKLDTDSSFRGMGGDKSQLAGLDLILHQKEVLFMGFWEVFKNLSKISKTLKMVKKDIIAFAPDLVLLIDYPGFNLRIAKFCKENNIPVHYYIAPKVWAWKENRIKKIRKYIDHLYSILPFEVDYFNKRNVEVKYVGNPSKEAIDRFTFDTTFLEKNNINKPYIALLPGSRKQEIDTSLPLMLKTMEQFSSYDYVIAQAPGFGKEYYQSFDKHIKVVNQDMYNLLHYSEASLVTSGTATLETALVKTPQIVCYRTSKLTYQIAKNLIKVKYISLVNLILDKPCVPELIQDEFNVARLSTKLASLLDGVDRQKMLDEYEELEQVLENSKPSMVVAKKLFGSLS